MTRTLEADQALLNSLMARQRETEAALIEDKESRVTFLAVGGAVSDPMTALTSDGFHAVLDQLSRSFDLVIVDAPQIIPAADARVLSTLVDSVIVLARWVGPMHRSSATRSNCCAMRAIPDKAAVR